MKPLYILSVKLYALAVIFASWYNRKASARYAGVKESFRKLKDFNSDKTAWFHCASLGEFEQGRSLIETFKETYPQYKIALSFFSPSGYEIRKNYELADLVFYLPSDSKKNAQKLLKELNPDIVFFIKYEFWYYYLKALKENNVPLYLVSGIFRPDQIFFKSYGKFFRKILKNFSHLFVQNESSKELLQNNGIQNISVTGDTRFDRVFELSENRKELELIKQFVNNQKVLIAGSSWKPDEEILVEYINKADHLLKFIIAPHVVKPDNINRIESLIKKKTIRYSDADNENVIDAEVLIINNIGMLSSLYAYADFAYIGGGFGAGIHNTLEAAVFGIPIIFGPNYKKFDEAKELISRKAAFSISNYNDFCNIFEKLMNDNSLTENAGKNASDYVNENIGASKKILDSISRDIS